VSRQPDVAYHPARILIVDDDRQNRELLEVMLSPEGVDIRSAISGEEALSMAAQELPDLILLDVMMPGMDGYAVAARVKGDLATKNIPIIMITALVDRDARMRGLQSGAEEFLTKPVDRLELCARVKNLLRLKAYGDYYDEYSQLLEGAVAARSADLEERTKQAAVLSDQAALLDLAQDAIVVRDMTGRIVFWNHGAERLYGWPSRDALGRNAHELLGTGFANPLDAIDAALPGQSRWEGEATHRTRTGERVIVASRWAVQRDADGTPVRILTIANDITARKRTEAELHVLTERLSLATAVAKVGVWEWDIASNMLTWDATMFDIYGCPSRIPMPYARWSATVRPEDLPAAEAAMRRAVAIKGQGSADYRITLPNGATRYISAVERAVLDEQANVNRVIGVDMDVTERKEAEAVLEQSRADQLRYRDEFLSHVSHELRSPLTAIKQFTSILLRGLAGDLNKEQREYQQIVLKNIGQLQSMIDDLLEVTYLETGKLMIQPEQASVSEAVTDSFDTLQGTAEVKGITLSVDVPPDIPFVHADRTRLRQILIILIENAIKFTPAGGTVSIRTRLSGQDAQFLLFEVSDTGCGITADATERIFERLYQVAGTQASRKGLGLGLYICKELVTRQGGQIWATRRQLVGSTFAFTLPIFAPRHAAAANSARGAISTSEVEGHE
jgi:PAS domain S-box-containing protein